MAASRTAKPIAELPPGLPAEVERAVRAAGSLPAGKLTRVKLGDAARRELERLLVAAGLERTAKVVRVPLAEQLLALVEGGGRASLKDAAKRVKGGSKKEIDAAIGALVREGRAKVVVRTQVEVLVGVGDGALSAAEVGEVVKAHAALAKVLKKVTAKGWARSLLREDLAALIGPIEGAAHPPPPAAKLDRITVLVAAMLRRLAVLGLARIPELVRALDAEGSVAEIHRALLAADDAGEIELRPESGGEFLSDEDARLCPPGPRGTVFSYARIVKP